MKKQVLLLFAALLFCQAAFAYDFSAVAPSGQTLYYSIIGSTSVEAVEPSSRWSGYTKPTGNLIIPDSVTYTGTTYQVTSIGGAAFYGCSRLTSVTIPTSVTSIGDYAFYNCTGITSPLYINTCFAYMPTSYNGVYVVPNGIINICGGAFADCSGLTSVTIPNSVNSIGREAFYNCSSLTAVHYNGTIGQWCGITFCNGNSNPLVIAHHLYINNAEVTSASIPNTITQIKPYTFYCCSGLTSVTIPTSVTSIGDYAFFGCSGLTSVTIPTSVTNIGEGAFWNCSGLTSVTIPTSVTSIADFTFSGCSGLTSVTIGNSVTSIGWGAFEDCSGLTSVTIPNSVTSIGGHAFEDCSGLTSVTIPNSVTNIGKYAFYNCSRLTSVTIPNSVTSIADYTFSGCSGLISVSIPNSVSSIGEWAFRYCSGLTSVTIGNSVTSIGNLAFCDCSGLTSVTIPNSVTSIGLWAFYGCSSLTSVTIGNSVTSISDSAFWGCRGLTSMSFLSSIPPQLGNEVFTGVSSNIPVYIPCGRLAYYASRIPYFTNYIEQLYEFSAASADESMGTVQVLTEPSCTNPNAVLNAVPANGYRFDHWSTGSTDNPYTLTVTNGTTIIGYFVANGTQGIGEVGEDDIHISVSNGHIHVEGVADEDVRVYDITGRMIQNCSLPSGVYIVKIGTLPAQKVVVMR